MKSAIFGDFTQRRIVISHRRFGTLAIKNRTDGLSRNVGKVGMKLIFFAVETPKERISP
jgi:hypothetical protein